MPINTDHLAKIMGKVQDIAGLGVEFANKIRDLKNDIRGVVREAEGTARDEEDGDEYDEEELRDLPPKVAKAAELLGLEEGVLTWEEVQEAYRDEAKRCHPDFQQDEKKKARAEKRMKRINEAYATLKEYFGE